MTLKFLDQTGLSLMLSLCKSWFPQGSGRQFEVPTRWGSQGRLNLIGMLALNAQGEHLEVRELTASCTQDAVIAYLDTLAAQSDTHSDWFLHKGHQWKRVWRVSKFHCVSRQAHCSPSTSAKVSRDSN